MAHPATSNDLRFFPEAYRRFCSIIDGNRPFILYGKVEEDFGAVTMAVNRVDRVRIKKIQ